MEVAIQESEAKFIRLGTDSHEERKEGVTSIYSENIRSTVTWLR